MYDISACTPLSFHHIQHLYSGGMFSVLLNYCLVCITCRFCSSLCQNQQNKDIFGGCHSGFQTKWLSASWTTKYCLICQTGKYFTWYDRVSIWKGQPLSLQNGPGLIQATTHVGNMRTVGSFVPQKTLKHLNITWYQSQTTVLSGCFMSAQSQHYP